MLLDWGLALRQNQVSPKSQYIFFFCFFPPWLLTTSIHCSHLLLQSEDQRWNPTDWSCLTSLCLPTAVSGLQLVADILCLDEGATDLNIHLSQLPANFSLWATIIVFIPRWPSDVLHPGDNRVYLDLDPALFCVPYWWLSCTETFHLFQFYSKLLPLPLTSFMVLVH